MSRTSYLKHLCPRSAQEQLLRPKASTMPERPLITVRRVACEGKDKAGCGKNAAMTQMRDHEIPARRVPVGME